MSFFSGFFASSTPSAAPPPPVRHGKKSSVQVGNPATARRQLGIEDDEVYGQASPRQAAPSHRQIRARTG